jgi:hypothetical protein
MQCYPRGVRAAEVACQRRRTANNTDDRRRSNRTRPNAMSPAGAWQQRADDRKARAPGAIDICTVALIEQGSMEGACLLRDVQVAQFPGRGR